MIYLSEAAQQRVRRFVAKQAGAIGVRVAVKRSGCSGYGYDIEVIEGLAEKDVVFAYPEFQVAVRQERTPRLKVDNNFYFARGYTWALLHQLRAIRHDFAVTLEQKTALASLDQIIAELEKAQKPVWSPIILNGRGFGFTANHSLVMASYISRVNAALIDIQALLRAG